MFRYYTPENVRKNFGFLTFSGGTEMEHWTNVERCLEILKKPFIQKKAYFSKKNVLSLKYNEVGLK